MHCRCLQTYVALCAQGYLTSLATELKSPASNSLPDFASFFTPRSIVSSVTPLYPALLAKSCSVSFSSTILFCLLALALLTSSSSSSSLAGIRAPAAYVTSKIGTHQQEACGLQGRLCESSCTVDSADHSYLVERQGEKVRLIIWHS